MEFLAQKVNHFVAPFWSKWCIMNRNKNPETQPKSVLEALRIDYTDLSQDEFVVKCELSRTTYQRWIRENISPRLTPEQIVAICRVCHISLNTFFQKLGFDISEISIEPSKK
jgi:transcriptional regulator with XRE-family HTH domain